MENQKVRISKTVVAGAEPSDRDYILWDTAIPGFGLRVRKTGGKSFIFAYRTSGGRAGKWQRTTIKADNPEVARERAKALAAEHYAGADPAADKADAKREAEREKLTPTVGDVLDRFVNDHARENLKAKTADEYERIIAKILKPRIGSIKIDELASKDVAELYHAMRATPTQAALAVRVLSSAMSWAGEFGLRPAGANPAAIRLKGTRRRKRLFSEAEVARLRREIDTMERKGRVLPSVALALRLLFATGCRAGEICDLTWANVDLEEGLLRWPDSKTGFLEKPITGEAAALLKAAERTVGVPWVCPSPIFKRLRVETLEAGFERVMAAAKVEARENASLHLIRHWFATKLYTDKSVALPVQMAIMGHASVATAMRYAHVSREEMKQAAEGAAERRTAAVKAAGKRGRVVSLQG